MVSKMMYGLNRQFWDTSYYTVLDLLILNNQEVLAGMLLKSPESM